MNKYLIQYTTDHKKLLIVVWANDKAGAKKMLKRHLGNALFTVNRITQEDVSDYPPYADWRYAR